MKQRRTRAAFACIGLLAMTDFQKRILAVVKAAPNKMETTWIIAQKAFPEKWNKKDGRRRSGRGALIGHIDRHGSAIPGIVRLPPRDQFGEATLCFEG